MFKKNLPEFEELAAMESGYAWRPITVRRAGPQTVAKSVMGTFVSGNYFRVFGLSPAAGRLFVDADDQKGAPITAVMSYDAWQQDYCWRSERGGKRVLHQYQAGHDHRRCAKGISTGTASIPIRPSTSFP